MASQMTYTMRPKGAGSRNRILIIGIRDTVDPALSIPEYARLEINQAVYDAMTAPQKTEADKAGATLTAFRAVTVYGTATDI